MSKSHFHFRYFFSLRKWAVGHIEIFIFSQTESIQNFHFIAAHFKNCHTHFPSCRKIVVDSHISKLFSVCGSFASSLDGVPYRVACEGHIPFNPLWVGSKLPYKHRKNGRCIFIFSLQIFHRNGGKKYAKAK